MNLISQMIPLLVIVIVIYLFIIRPIKRKNRTTKQTLNYEQEINSLKNEIIVATTENIPNKKVVEILGPVRGVSTAATTQEEFKRAEAEALYSMLVEAKALGANAVLGSKIETGTYQHQGSSWQVSHVIYTGTAAIVE